MRNSIRIGSATLTRFLASVFCVAAASTCSVHAQEKTPWTRIVIVGASVSDGFTASIDDDEDYALDRYLKAALLAPHEPVRNLANALFFMMPDASGSSQITQAMTNRPTLVVGIVLLRRRQNQPGTSGPL
jgi:hypothetical protein